MTFDFDKIGRKLDEEIAQGPVQVQVQAFNSLPSSDWPALDPLPEIPEVAPAKFPFAAMGPLLGNAAQAIARDVQAPDSLVGGSVLAAAALAVQSHANVVLPHGQRSPLSLFVITGAASGDRKSAVDKVACQAVVEVREQQVRRHAQARVNYEADMAQHQPGTPAPTPPRSQSLLVSNVTVEGLHRLLQHQPSVGVFTAEGGEFLGGHSMREDRRTAGLAFFLKGWGGETLDAVRVSSDSLALLGRRMTLSVMVQPLPLRLLLGDPLAQDQGLLARCLIAQPASLAGGRRFKKVDPNADPHVQAYHQRLKFLLERQPVCVELGDGHELALRDLPLDDAAAELWEEFFNEVEVQQGAGGALEGARPFASKAAEQAARLAGVIALVERPEATHVDSEAMYGGIALAQFYLAEHVRLTQAGRREREGRRLEELLLWLRARAQQGGLVPEADILQRTPAAIRSLKAAGIKPLLADLERRGYIRRVGNAWQVRPA